MKQHTKGNAVILALILVVILAGIGLLLSRGLMTKPAQVPSITSKEELNQTSKDLDTVNVNDLDTGLNEVSKEANAL